MIFVQIAAYRDPDLAATVADCIAKAIHPERLSFGVCLQRLPGENEDFLAALPPNTSILDVAAPDSPGLGWARQQTQGMYAGERFTLQIDSHHRFAYGWDAKLICEMQLTKSAKPIITAYAGMLDGEFNPHPFKMVADKFTESGTILFRPHYIEDWQRLERPLPARFVSGHYFFTLGSHCLEYKYDPGIYFAGDEISLAVRSYTLGYDLFHPHRTYLWHEYTRQNRTKHWDDHVPENGLKAWHVRDTESKVRLRQLLGEEDSSIDLGEFGLGSVRSMADYERYAGIDFATRTLNESCLKGTEPQ